jgi:hypothetical protein
VYNITRAKLQLLSLFSHLDIYWKECIFLLMSNSLIELPFYNVDLIQEFSFNNNLNLPTMKHLNSYSSMYDLGLFNIDTSTDTNVDINSSHPSIRSQYYSPYKFAELKNSETKHIILNKS